MRIIFMGTPDFAVPSLELLIDNGYNIVAVITASDKYGGRGRKQLLESPVKKAAQKHNIQILQPKNLKSPAFIEKLAALKADLQIVVAFRMLPVVVWDMPPLGTYNLHASLLPAFRGAAPINWAIISGEEVTGLTTFKLKHEIDTGSIAFQHEMPIERSDTAGTLHNKMMVAGADLVLRTADAIAHNEIMLREQDNEKVSHAPKINHEDCEIDFNRSVIKVYNFIRGMSPYPTAWTMLLEKKLKIYTCLYSYECHDYKAGTILSDGKKIFKISCEDGFMYPQTLQWEGRKRMDISSFINGLNLTANKIQIL